MGHTQHCDRSSTTGQACPSSSIFNWFPILVTSLLLQKFIAGIGFDCCVQWTGGSGRAVAAGGSVHLAPAKCESPGDLGLPRPVNTADDGLCRCWGKRGGDVPNSDAIGDVCLPARCFAFFEALLLTPAFLPAILFIEFVIYFDLGDSI